MTRLPLTWLVIRNALWVGKKLFAAQQVISPECGRCGDLEETISHAFFHCPVVRPLCKLLEGYMVRILNGKFFVLEAQFCVQQCGAEVEQTGTLCVSLLARRYACRDLDDENEGTLRG